MRFPITKRGIYVGDAVEGHGAVDNLNEMPDIGYVGAMLGRARLPS